MSVRKIDKALRRRTGAVWIQVEEGQGLAEYTMILAFAVVVCVAAVTALGVTAVNSPAWTIANAL